VYKRKKSRWYSDRKRGNKTKDGKYTSHIVYDDKDVAVILQNTSLYTVISDYLPLRRKGCNYVSRCPFCRDLGRNNSFFVVSTQKRKYKCFICGVGGRHPTSFLRRYHNITFSRAISHINRYYHKGKYPLKEIKNITVDKRGCNIDEDLPF
jgi:DNA primase